MKKAIITLADRRYIEKAKQLFSGIYFFGNWDGDYLLIAPEVPEKDLSWFTKRGVKIIDGFKPIKIKNWNSRKSKERVTPIMITCKWHIFSDPILKKWDKIVYLDTDIIVQGDISEIADVQEIGAVVNFDFPRIKDQFSGPMKGENINKELAFNAGVVALDTKIIQKKNLKEIVKLAKKNVVNARFGEQPILNLFFRKKWRKLPFCLNFQTRNVSVFLNRFASVLHFCGTAKKPWDPQDYYYKIWQRNLKNADKIKYFPKKNHSPNIKYKINKMISQALGWFFVGIKSYLK